MVKESLLVFLLLCRADVSSGFVSIRNVPAPPTSKSFLKAASPDSDPGDPQAEIFGALRRRAQELGLSCPPQEPPAAASETTSGHENGEPSPPVSELEQRMLELNMDPNIERHAASTRVAESAAVILDRNELKRRYYEEFFKARVLRGVGPEKAPSETARAADLLSAAGFASALVATGGPLQTAPTNLQGSPWPGDRVRPAMWVASAEVRHGRAATVGLLYYLAAASSQVAGDWGAFAQGLLAEWQQPPPPLPPLPWTSEVWTAPLPPGTECLLAGVAAVAVALELADATTAARVAGEAQPGTGGGDAAAPTAARAAPLASLTEAVTAACEPVASVLGPRMARLEASEVLHGRAAMLLASPLLFHAIAPVLLAHLP